MIAHLRGRITRIDGSQITIDVQGVGYSVLVSGRTGNRLGSGDGEIVLLTEMQVREDSLSLFGFIDVAERDAFRLLVTVQGVGAKAAMAILSVLNPHELSIAIISKDNAMVARADGVGPKIAQRVVNELSEKISKIETLGGAFSVGDIPGAIDAGSDDDGGVCRDAVSALVNLGYGRAEAHAAVLRALAKTSDVDLSATIASALQEMNR
jgi:Holliday junction DNA helicase RuvA